MNRRMPSARPSFNQLFNKNALRRMPAISLLIHLHTNSYLSKLHASRPFGSEFRHNAGKQYSYFKEWKSPKHFLYHQIIETNERTKNVKRFFLKLWTLPQLYLSSMYRAQWQYIQVATMHNFTVSDASSCEGKSVASATREFDNELDAFKSKVRFSDSHDEIKGISQLPPSDLHATTLLQGQIKPYLEKWLESDEEGRKIASKGFSADAIIKVFDLLRRVGRYQADPFVLTLVASQIPRIVDEFPEVNRILECEQKEEQYNESDTDAENNIEIDITFYQIAEWYFDTLVRNHFRILSVQEVWPQSLEDEFVKSCRIYCEELAHAIVQENDRALEIESIDRTVSRLQSKEQSFKHAHVIQSIPICIRNGKLKFLHTSLMEFFLASRCLAPFSRRMEKDMMTLFLVNTLGVCSFTNDKCMLDIHAEAIASKLESQTLLGAVVLESRTKRADYKDDKILTTASSNAISILQHGANLGLLRFNYQDQSDWSKIRIPKANLTLAMLLDCNLDGADLHEATITNASFNGSTLRGVNLRNARTGLPVTHDEVNVIEYEFSNSGEYLATATPNTLSIWDSETKNLISSIGFAASISEPIRSCDLCFSHDDQVIAIIGDMGVRFYSLLPSKAAMRNCENNTSERQDIKTPKADLSLSEIPELTLVGSFSNDHIGFYTDSGGNVNPILGQVYAHAFSSFIDQDGTMYRNCMIIVTRTHFVIVSLMTGVCFNWKHNVEIDHAFFSPDGQRLVLRKRTTYCDVVIYDVTNMTILKDFSIGSKMIDECATFSRDGRSIYFGLSNGEIVAYDIEQDRFVATFKGPSWRILSVNVSRDNRFIVSRSHYGTIRVWDLSSTRCIAIMPSFEKVNRVRFTPDSTAIAFFDTNNSTLKQLNYTHFSTYVLKTEQANIFKSSFQMLSLPSTPSSSCDVLNTSETFGAYLQFQKCLKFWDLKSGCQVRQMKIMNCDNVLPSDNGLFVLAQNYSYNSHQKADIYETSTGKLKRAIDLSFGAYMQLVPAFSSDNCFVAIPQHNIDMDEDENVKELEAWVDVWDINSNNPPIKISSTLFVESYDETFNYCVDRCAFSHDGEYIAIAYTMRKDYVAEKSSIALFRRVRLDEHADFCIPESNSSVMKGYKKIKHIELEKPGTIHNFAFHPNDSRYAVIGSLFDSTFVYDFENEMIVEKWKYCMSLQFSGNGQMLTLFGYSESIIIETKNWKPRITIDHGEIEKLMGNCAFLKINSISTTTDGKHIVIVGENIHIFRFPQDDEMKKLDVEAMFKMTIGHKKLDFKADITDALVDQELRLQSSAKRFSLDNIIEPF